MKNILVISHLTGYDPKIQISLNGFSLWANYEKRSCNFCDIIPAIVINIEDEH